MRKRPQDTISVQMPMRTESTESLTDSKLVQNWFKTGSKLVHHFPPKISNMSKICFDSCFRLFVVPQNCSQNANATSFQKPKKHGVEPVSACRPSEHSVPAIGAGTTVKQVGARTVRSTRSRVFVSTQSDAASWQQDSVSSAQDVRATVQRVPCWHGQGETKGQERL